uniref:F-box/LRR-repeat protein 15-like leucin rich repeat domain-containing protein n=1 Tax=Salix viminalis TaxID=40686 RepID=A0A6N2MS22_SALVM
MLSSTLKQKQPTPEPVTPTRHRDTSTHHLPPNPNPPRVLLLGSDSDSRPPRSASLRLASKSHPSADASLQTPTRKRKMRSDGKQGRLVIEDDVVDKMNEREELRVLCLRSGKKVVDNCNIEIEGKLEGEEVRGSSVMRTKDKEKERKGDSGKKVLKMDVEEDLWKRSRQVTIWSTNALRHRLCNCSVILGNECHILALLVHGSPMEIRIEDCSWLAEEEFTKVFEVCDSLNLTCGRCMADYTLLATLARSPSSLPRLTTLSIRGACRLSDAALSSLVSSRPALQSLNLSQCSLLTSASIDTLADSLATSLAELYIDDCQSIHPMLILPALKKLEHLEVLSLSGIQTIDDNFLREFIISLCHNIKELVLTDCVKLTDSLMKVIAENCSKLCALDLGNLRKLTDSALGFLANACREIHTLKLCRNAFSDEAIAAFVETSGEILKELSLNNVKKAGHSTALSLARSRRLVSLDLSWCRNLTNEALGLIVDSCLSLKVLKLFGCSQVTNVFIDGHSNSDVQIIGLKMSRVLEHVRVPELQQFPLRYSSVSSI